MSPSIRRFVAYYRVSTARQGRSGLGLEAQKAAVLAFINGHAELVAEFTEVESGKHAEREELKKAIAACKKHKAKLVIAKLRPAVPRSRLHRHAGGFRRRVRRNRQPARQERSTIPSGDLTSRKPITGTFGCCARAASGHAAAPPMSVINSRRFNFAITRSPRWRGRANRQAR